ncbi:MAG: acetate/propionate family kinase [Pseudomonadota bacterium]|nr:acetate/propionate family kinase [Pseudomonadota bacterium]
MPGSVLTLNAGSSSLKFALFDVNATSEGEMLATARGQIEGLEEAPHLLAHDATGAVLAEQHWQAGIPRPFTTVLDALLAFAEAHLGDAGLAAVGHRIVHGGAKHITPARVTPALLTDLEALTSLDPLHMPHNVAPIHAVAASRPALAQVACFDTAFHHTLPPVARRCGLPRALEAAGVRRYGFHGLSYEYIAARLARDAPALARGRVIAAHLGSGASLCALHEGRSIATTMGFSALDGLLMATRCGSLDPGVMLYLGRQGHSFTEIENMLYHRSGLLGISGISGDIRELLASNDPHAREAIELFTYRIATEAGALVSALGGLDGLVFTAGIGEHAPAVRAAVCARLTWLGLRLDVDANAAGAPCISTPDSAVEVRVIATDEEAVIARHTRRLSSK